MEVVINGNSEAGNYGTVAELLEKRDLDPKLVVVELNGQVLPKDRYDQSLKEGDTLEIVQFVAGG